MPFARSSESTWIAIDPSCDATVAVRALWHLERSERYVLGRRKLEPFAHVARRGVKGRNEFDGDGKSGRRRVGNVGRRTDRPDREYQDICQDACDRKHGTSRSAGLRIHAADLAVNRSK
jgi:hypothetical protein